MGQFHMQVPRYSQETESDDEYMLRKYVNSS